MVTLNASELERTRLARLPRPRSSSRAPSVRRTLKNGHDAKGCCFQAEVNIKEAGKMKADAGNILKTYKLSIIWIL
jgi:hypothetical protein